MEHAGSDVIPRISHATIVIAVGWGLSVPRIFGTVTYARTAQNRATKFGMVIVGEERVSIESVSQAPTMGTGHIQYVAASHTACSMSVARCRFGRST